jgi:hypothetical protein
MIQPKRTLDDLAITLRQKTANNAHVCDNLSEITNLYNHKLRRLDPENESARLNAYIYAKPEDKVDCIPADLIEWHGLSIQYIKQLHTEITHILENKINAIQKSRNNIKNLIKTRSQKMIENRITNSTETKIEETTLLLLNKLIPMDVIIYIQSFMMTPQIRLALYRLPKSRISTAITAIKSTSLKTYLKLLRQRALPVTSKLREEAVRSGYIKQSDYSPLHNIYGQTKKEITSIIQKTIECYEYIYNIIKHKPSCEVSVKMIIKELLYIYESTIYIARPEFNKRAKPIRILQNPANQQAAT